MHKTTRVLIADNGVGQSILSEALIGYEIYTANTSQEALRLLLEDHFDVIVCGIHFDDSRMVDLCQAIRNDTRHKQTPLIAFRATAAEHADMLRQSATALKKTLRLSCYLELETFSQLPDPLAALRRAIESTMPAGTLVKMKSGHR